MFNKIRYLLLQVRNADDPMRAQEIGCFARSLNCEVDQILPIDLLQRVPTRGELDEHHIILIGGSGHYGAVEAAPWLDRTCDFLRELHERALPTFASCWGFQAISLAMKGQVVKDPGRAELGTHELRLSEDGKRDPLFGPLGEVFHGQMGHEDRVLKLPEDAILLASSQTNQYQAYRFSGKPIYCTQFHPELDRKHLLERLKIYPNYVKQISGLTLDELAKSCFDTPGTQELLPRFVKIVLQ